MSGTELQGDMVYSVYAVGEGVEDLEVVVVADEAHDMPSEMPATGMGGASQSNTFLPLLLTVIASGAALTVFFRKKMATQA